MPDVVAIPSLVSIWNGIKKIPIIIRHPLVSGSQFINVIRSWWRYHVLKDKEYNFAVNKRVTHHTIYPDGTLIMHSIYSITMIAAGNFEGEKFYESENNEIEDGKRKVNMNNMPKAKLKLDHTIKENRFTDMLNVVELITGQKEGSRFFVNNEEKTDSKYSYKIFYTGLKLLDTFKIHVCTTIPREFDRDNKRDSIVIEPIYGVYEFTSKIDKQSKDRETFVTEKINETTGKGNSGEDVKHVFYDGHRWEMLLPKKGEIKFKNITD